MGSPAFLLYEDIPKVDMWLKIMLGCILLMFLVLGVVLLFQDMEGAFAMFGALVFDALLFKLVMPQRYQIYSDRVRIVLGRPFAWSIPLNTIKEARSASGSKAFAYGGVRFATSSKGVVEITRSRGCNVVISPLNMELFLEQLNRAMKNAKG